MQTHTSPSESSETVLMDLGEGLQMRVQVAPESQSEGEVSTSGLTSERDLLSPDSAFAAIRALSKRLGDVLREVQPTKASVKYGLELEVRDGTLLATLVRGGGKTSLEVTLEWEQPKDG